MNDQASALRRMVKENKGKDNLKTAQSNTRIMSIASGKGGVGKTNITVNLGLALQKLDNRVLLLDGDLGMANIDILLGLTSTYTLQHVMNGRCRLEDAILEGPHNINVLPGISGGDAFVNINKQEVKRLLKASSHLEDNYDIILIDIGAGANQGVMNFTLAADEALIVLTPEPTSIMDAYSFIKILANSNFKGDLGLIINQVSSSREGKDVVNRMKSVISEYLDLEIKFNSFIPYDSQVVQAVKKQQSLLELFPDSEAAKAFRAAADKLLDREPETPPRGMKGFIYRVVGMFKKG